jgi:hypothetical protein
LKDLTQRRGEAEEREKTQRKGAKRQRTQREEEKKSTDSRRIQKGLDTNSQDSQDFWMLPTLVSENPSIPQLPDLFFSCSLSLFFFSCPIYEKWSREPTALVVG